MHAKKDKIMPAPKKDKGPTVIVGGVTVSGPRPERKPSLGHKKPWALPLLGLLMGAALFGATLLTGCAGSASLALRQDGSLGISLDAGIPGALAAKLRKLSSLSEGAPLFDVEAARRTATSHQGLTSLTIGAPGPDAYTARIEAPSLEALLSEPELASSGALRITTGQGWKELELRLERGHVEALLGLAPGLDRELLEALSPPALDPEPITKAEYHSMLRGILGEKALASLDAAVCRLSITVPGRVLGSSGGRLEGRSLSASIPILDLLVLEEPIDLKIRWASN